MSAFSTKPYPTIIAQGQIDMRIGIIGLGTVGRAIRDGFESSHEIFIHDKDMGTAISDVTDNAEVAYIAVPTPSIDGSGACDTGVVEDVLDELPSGFSAIIKSTVIPGTTQRLHDSYPDLKIACSPEFLRSATSVDDFKRQDILVVGSHHEDLAETVLSNHQEAGVFSGEAFFHVSPTQAELVKYAKNSFYSMKVIFGNQFQEYAQSLGEEWGAVKEIITTEQEQRIGPSHLDLIEGGERGFGGDCLPKDTLALVADLERRGLGYDLLKAVLSDNLRLRGED